MKEYIINGQEYGFDIADMKAFKDEGMTIEIDTSKWTKEQWEVILGGVAIIRCKDCEYHRNRTNRCDAWSANTPADGHCYRAKKKGEKE